jgi:STAM-binding protein
VIYCKDMAGIRVGFGQPQPPRNVSQITKAAQTYEYDAGVPIRYWLRTAATLVKEVCLKSHCESFEADLLPQAEIYQKEGDDETTYFLLFRHAHLVLANLTSHPGVHEGQFRAAWKEANETVQQELKLLDQLRPKINERYERYKKLTQDREARAQAQQRQVRPNDLMTQDGEHFDRQNARQINAIEHKDFAIRLAHREHSRRAAVSSEATSPTSRPDVDDMQRRLQALRERIDNKEQPASAVTALSHAQRQDSNYKYPTIPLGRPQQSSALSPLIPHHIHSPSLAPALPPKPQLSSFPSNDAPQRPDKIPQSTGVPPPRPDTPSDDRMFAAAAQLENGTALRTIFLPSTLRTTFLRHAYKNTQANLETCGFLAGTLMKNAFFVSKLVIPSQTATPDTCEMTNESELFDFVDASDLMILGWIHTHPSQTCFMSSRDLHTHSGYQMMLAESVAIVCAPSKGDILHGGEYGVYRLTDPPGKKAILNCQKPGVFHPHEVDNIYTDALRPGHVVEAPDMPFDVVDLR